MARVGPMVECFARVVAGFAWGLGSLGGWVRVAPEFAGWLGFNEGG